MKYPDNVRLEIEDIDQRISDRIGILVNGLEGEYEHEIYKRRAIARMVRKDQVISILNDRKVGLISTSIPTYILEED